MDPAEEKSHTMAHVHVPQAGSGLGLLMQGGAGVECMTGISVEALLREELALPATLLDQIDVFFLDGKPVDDIKTALVPCGSRLALAGGLPGIAGLAMRSGSALAGLRPGITFRQEAGHLIRPCPGRIEVALFSLGLSLLAASFLIRGIVVNAKKLRPYLRPALMMQGEVNGNLLPLEAIQAWVEQLPPHTEIGVTADIRTQ